MYKINKKSMTIEEVVYQREKAIAWVNQMYNYYNKSYFDKIALDFFKYEKIIGTFDEDKNTFIETENNHKLNIELLIDFTFKLQDLFEYFDSKDCYIIDENWLEGDLDSYMYSLFSYKFGKHYDLLFDYIEDFGYNDRYRLINDITDFYLDLMNNKFNQ